MNLEQNNCGLTPVSPSKGFDLNLLGGAGKPYDCEPISVRLTEQDTLQVSNDLAWRETANLEAAWKRSMEGWILYFWVNKDKLQVYVMSSRLKRDYFTFEQGQQIDDYERAAKLPNSMRGAGRWQMYMLHPQYQVDPHLPPHLRRSK